MKAEQDIAKFRNTLSTAGAPLQQFSKNLQVTGQDMGMLGTKAQSTSAPVQQLGKNVQGVNTPLQQLDKNVKTTQQSMTGLTAPTEKVTKDMQTLEKNTASVNAPMQQLDKNVKGTQQSMSAITAPTQKAAQSMDKLVGSQAPLANAFQKTKAQASDVIAKNSQLATGSQTLGTRIKESTGKFAGFATGLSATTTSVLQLGAGFRDYSDSQIAVDRQTRKVSLAHEALTKAQDKLNALTAKGIKSGKEYQQAQLDVTQAQQNLDIQTQLLGERQEDMFDAQSQFVASVIPTTLGAVGTLGSAFKDLGLNATSLKGVFSKAGGIFSGLISGFGNVAKEAPKAADAISNIGLSAEKSSKGIGTMTTALASLAIGVGGALVIKQLGDAIAEVENKMSHIKLEDRLAPVEAIMDKTGKASKQWAIDIAESAARARIGVTDLQIASDKLFGTHFLQRAEEAHHAIDKTGKIILQESDFAGTGMTMNEALGTSLMDVASAAKVPYSAFQNLSTVTLDLGKDFKWSANQYVAEATKMLDSGKDQAAVSDWLTKSGIKQADATKILTAAEQNHSAHMSQLIPLTQEYGQALGKNKTIGEDYILTQEQEAANWQEQEALLADVNKRNQENAAAVAEQTRQEEILTKAFGPLTQAQKLDIDWRNKMLPIAQQQVAAYDKQDKELLDLAASQGKATEEMVNLSNNMEDNQQKMTQLLNVVGILTPKQKEMGLTQEDLNQAIKDTIQPLNGLTGLTLEYAKAAQQAQLQDELDVKTLYKKMQAERDRIIAFKQADEAIALLNNTTHKGVTTAGQWYDETQKSIAAGKVEHDTLAAWAEKELHLKDAMSLTTEELKLHFQAAWGDIDAINQLAGKEDELSKHAKDVAGTIEYQKQQVANLGIENQQLTSTYGPLSDAVLKDTDLRNYLLGLQDKQEVAFTKEEQAVLDAAQAHGVLTNAMINTAAQEGDNSAQLKQMGKELNDNKDIMQDGNAIIAERVKEGEDLEAQDAMLIAHYGPLNKAMLMNNDLRKIMTDAMGVEVETADTTDQQNLKLALSYGIVNDKLIELAFNHKDDSIESGKLTTALVNQRKEVEGLTPAVEAHNKVMQYGTTLLTQEHDKLLEDTLARGANEDQIKGLIDVRGKENSQITQTNDKLKILQVQLAKLPPTYQEISDATQKGTLSFYDQVKQVQLNTKEAAAFRAELVKYVTDNHLVADATSKTTEELLTARDAYLGNADAIAKVIEEQKKFKQATLDAEKSLATVFKIKVEADDKEFKKFIKGLDKSTQKEYKIKTKFDLKAESLANTFQKALALAGSGSDKAAKDVAEHMIQTIDKTFKGKGEKAFPGLIEKLEAAAKSPRPAAAMAEIWKTYDWSGVGTFTGEQIGDTAPAAAQTAIDKQDPAQLPTELGAVDQTKFQASLQVAINNANQTNEFIGKALGNISNLTIPVVDQTKYQKGLQVAIDNADATYKDIAKSIKKIGTLRIPVIDETKYQKGLQLAINNAEATYKAIKKAIAQIGNLKVPAVDHSKFDNSLDDMVTKAQNTVSKIQKILGGSNLNRGAQNVKAGPSGGEYAQAAHGMHQRLERDTIIQAHAGEQVDIEPTIRQNVQRIVSKAEEMEQTIIINVLDKVIMNKIQSRLGRNTYQYGVS